MSFTNLLRRLIVCLAVLAAGLSVPAFGAGVSVGTPVATCMRPALPGQTARQMMADVGGFDCRRAQPSFGPGDFWVMSGPLPRVDTRLLARSGSVWLRSYTLHVLYADGAIRSMGIVPANAGRHLALGAMFQLALPQRHARPVRLLWEVRGAPNLRGVILGAALATVPQVARSEKMMAGLYGMFGGLCLALLIYNLALWGALRQRFLPAYCVMVMFLMGYAVTSSGLLGQLTAIDNNDRQRLNTLFLAAATVGAMGFARAFFERRVFAGWIGRATTTACVTLMVAALTFAALAPWQAWWLDRLCTLGYIMTVGMTGPVLWRAWRLRSPYVRSFALAWGAPLCFAGFRILAALDVIHWRFWIDNSTLFAMALEASLSALAIAYRIRLLSEERDIAREQEMMARMLADSDPLTGLMNRRAFLREAIGQRDAKLLVLIDIDHFKTVNETLGHDGGDEVLRLLSRALRQAAPDGALVARLGGEEFAILSDADANGLPDATLAAIRAARMPFDVSVTASIGSDAGVIGNEGDWAQLYRGADQALFAAKKAGRDRARSAGAPSGALAA
jgi:diguanylate cyclase (GGDEF)-like protein